MAGPQWRNVYRLSEHQLERLEEAASRMEMLDIDNAECVPVLNNLGHMHGRYLSEWEKAVEFYERVLQIEPDNAWARDERRRYQRYLTRD